jgi:DNA (cytosine-5)-methyltransferase 1
MSRLSAKAKRDALDGRLRNIHEENTPQLDASALMPRLPQNGLRALSLFSGGGGLDLGFDLAGYEHSGSFELIPICGDTLRQNRPRWVVNAGPVEGDVTQVDWDRFAGEVDVIQGGPPCQPFSIAGQQKGLDDERNMWGEFVRSIRAIQPIAFVAENVLGLLNPKFENFVQEQIIRPLGHYHIARFQLNSADFGVPQIRRRVFFVGFLEREAYRRFQVPTPTHTWSHLRNGVPQRALGLFDDELPPTMGVRQALGLADIGYDNLAPTLRSGFTGKRNTTSILNSTAAAKAWSELLIWPNGVQNNRSVASAFPADNEHFRLSIQDCALLQGFPSDWEFAGAVYQILGQIGNSVAPPVAYAVARSVAEALDR